ncbi:MAG TPA: hypothetical protein VD902_09800, partial [Symbiobacteriaceae bacterium]|nr:hypothetical protein [Symbiobacteriaceae bacterium]
MSRTWDYYGSGLPYQDENDWPGPCGFVVMDAAQPIPAQQAQMRAIVAGMLDSYRIPPEVARV